MEKVIYEAQGNVDSIKPTEVRGISVIEVSTEHGDTITIELPSDLLKFKGKERVRIIFSKSEDVEDVDELFNPFHQGNIKNIPVSLIVDVHVGKLVLLPGNTN